MKRSRSSSELMKLKHAAVPRDRGIGTKEYIRKSAGAPWIPDELTKTYGPNDDPKYRSFRALNLLCR